MFYNHSCNELIKCQDGLQNLNVVQQAILALRNILEMKTINLFLLFILVFPAIQAQNLKQKKPVDFTVWDSWKTIENHQISNNGKWVSYEIKPYKGDGRLWIHNPEKNIKSEVEREHAQFFRPDQITWFTKLIHRQILSEG
jgi:hypothetical protein